MLCLVDQLMKGYGHGLTARKFKDVINNLPYQEKVKYIFDLALEHKMYCPDIFISENVVCMFFEHSPRFVKFFISEKEINVQYGSKLEASHYKWSEKSNMAFCATFLYKGK